MAERETRKRHDAGVASPWSGNVIVSAVDVHEYYAIEKMTCNIDIPIPSLLHVRAADAANTGNLNPELANSV